MFNVSELVENIIKSFSKTHEIIVKEVNSAFYVFLFSPFWLFYFKLTSNELTIKQLYDFDYLTWDVNRKHIKLEKYCV